MKHPHIPSILYTRFTGDIPSAVSYVDTEFVIVMNANREDNVATLSIRRFHDPWEPPATEDIVNACNELAGHALEAIPWLRTVDDVRFRFPHGPLRLDLFGPGAWRGFMTATTSRFCLIGGVTPESRNCQLHGLSNNWQQVHLAVDGWQQRPNPQ